MKMHITNYALVFALVIGVTSCKKEIVEATDESAPALSSAQSQEQGDDIDAEAAFRLDPSQSASGCPTITMTAPRGTYPNTITIDFGTSCTGFNGRVKSGQIIVEESAAHNEAGSVRTVTPQNFSVDDYQIEGSRVVTNAGLNEQGQMSWTIVVNHTVTNPEGGVATWSANRVRTLVEGGDTEGCMDNVVSLSGSASGVAPNGEAFTSTIVSPLVKRMDCRWPVSGVEELSIEGRDGVRSIDFGSGECDDKATVTTPNGTSREITIRRRGR
jgi:hypothetical protein